MEVIMKNYAKFFLKPFTIFLTAIYMLSLIIMGIAAVNVYAQDSTSKKYVTDNAGILTDDEISKLEKLCSKSSDDCKTDIFIVTLTDGFTESQLDTYLRTMMAADDYGYNNTSQSSSPDAIAFAIDMTSRKYRISSSGNSKSDISQSDMDNMVSGVKKYLSDGDYYAGCKKFVNAVEKSMNTSISYRLFNRFGIKTAIAAVAATVAIVIMMYNAKSKMTVDSRTYTKDHGFDVNARQDIFINTTVTTRHIDRGNNSSSGGSSGSSGGGNSGGGGGSF